MTVKAKLTRKEIADRVKEAVGYYLFHMKYSVSYELGVLPWGRRRADVIANKISGALIIVEVKSSVADFTTDSKWTEYLHHADKFYLAMPFKVWARIRKNRELLKTIPGGVGVLTLGKTGFMKVRKQARNMDLSDEARIPILARLAWRRGELSKRTTRARKRIYLD